MTSKESIQNEINSLKDMLENARKKNLRTITKACEEDIEQYNQVLKDLEVLEILKKYLKHIEINDLFYGVISEEHYSLSIFKDLYKEDYDKIKEWLNEKPSSKN